jgi:IS30 family transposase
MKNSKKYVHLSLEERKHLSYLYNKKGRGNLRKIGEEMKRSPNTIGLEIKAGLVDGIYEPEVAERKAKIKRRRSKSQLLKLLQDGDLRKKVEKDIRKNISPRRISGGLKEKDVIISPKSIYKFVHAYNLESFLCLKGKERSPKGNYIYRKAKELDKVRIKDRPLIEGIYGHYEMDFIVSSLSSYTLLVVVERKNKTVHVRRIQNRTHEVVIAALKDIFKGKLVLSITTDNDIAFGKWKEMEKELNTKIYFCEPYHSWEKGLVENTNRWIRLFVKKKSDIELVTESKLEKICSWFNDYPREIIGFKTSSELELVSLRSLPQGPCRKV